MVIILILSSCLLYVFSIGSIIAAQKIEQNTEITNARKAISIVFDETDSLPKEADLSPIKEGAYGQVIPIIVNKKGYIDIIVPTKSNNVDYSLKTNCSLYSDSQLTKRIKRVDDCQSNNYSFYVARPGEYFLAAYIQKGIYTKFKVEEKWDVRLYSDEVKKVEEGNYEYAYSSKVGNPIYLKYKAKKNGVFLLKATKLGYIKVLNKRSKEISYEASAGNSIRFAVKKGKEYTIRIRYKWGSVNGYIKDSFITSFKKANITSGKTKKSAMRLTNNKKRRGIIALENNNTVWYKFKLRKTRKCQIKLDAQVNGKIKTKLYKGKKQVLKKNCVSGEQVLTNNYRFDKNNGKVEENKIKLKKGTYYIKVMKKGKLSSGIFNVIISY